MFGAIVLSIVWLGRSRERDTPDFPDDSVYGGGRFQADQVRGNIATTYFTWMQLVMIAALVVVALWSSACLCGGLRR